MAQPQIGDPQTFTVYYLDGERIEPKTYWSEDFKFRVTEAGVLFIFYRETGDLREIFNVDSWHAIQDHSWLTS